MQLGPFTPHEWALSVGGGLVTASLLAVIVTTRKLARSAAWRSWRALRTAMLMAEATILRQSGPAAREYLLGAMFAEVASAVLWLAVGGMGSILWIAPYMARLPSGLLLATTIPAAALVGVALGGVIGAKLMVDLMFDAYRGAPERLERCERTLERLSRQ